MAQQDHESEAKSQTEIKVFIPFMSYLDSDYFQAHALFTMEIIDLIALELMVPLQHGDHVHSPSPLVSPLSPFPIASSLISLFAKHTLAALHTQTISNVPPHATLYPINSPHKPRAHSSYRDIPSRAFRGRPYTRRRCSGTRKEATRQPYHTANIHTSSTRRKG